jgi:sugar phosphate isomerase/epimerase
MLKNVVGAQMYTVREFTKDLPGVAASLKKVADIGYTAIQISGFGPADPKEVAKLCEDKCDHPAIGGLPGEYHTPDGLRRFLDELAPVAEKLAVEGMDFSYHNHNHELVKYGGKTWLAMLYEQAPPDMLKAEIDTYWIQAGGGDPAAWVRMCAGREPLLHLKDFAMGPGREQRFAEIGEGNLNWPAILQAAQEGGVEWYLVEQDRSYERDPFESLAISYRNLNEMGLS